MFGSQGYLLHAPQWLAAHVKALIPWNKGDKDSDLDESDETHAGREKKGLETADAEHATERCHFCKTSSVGLQRLECGHTLCNQCSVDCIKFEHQVLDGDLTCPICIDAVAMAEKTGCENASGGVASVALDTEPDSLDWKDSTVNMMLRSKAGTNCKVHNLPCTLYCKKDMCRRVICRKCADTKHVDHSVQPLSERYEEDRQQLEMMAAHLAEKKIDTEGAQFPDLETKQTEEGTEGDAMAGMDKMSGSQSLQGVIDTRVNRIAEMVRTHAENLKEQEASVDGCSEVRETLETPMDFEALRKRMEQLKLLQDFVEHLVTYGTPDEIVRMGPDLKLAVERLTAVCAAQASQTLPSRVQFDSPEVDHDAIVAMITSDAPPTDEQISSLVGHLEITQSDEPVDALMSNDDDMNRLIPLPNDDVQEGLVEPSDPSEEEDNCKKILVHLDEYDGPLPCPSNPVCLLDRGCLLYHFQTHLGDDNEEPMLWDLCTGLSGEIAVTDGANQRLKVFSKDGRLIWATPPGSVPPAYGVTWWREKQGFLMSVEDSGLYLALPDGSVEKLSRHGPLGPIKRPVRLAVDEEGRIFILETTQGRGRRVTVWSADGGCILKIWRTSPGARYISVCKDLVLIVVPHERKLIVYNTWGDFQWEISGGKGEVDRPHLTCPTGVGAHLGQIFLADCSKHSVMVVSSYDRQIRKFVSRRQGLNLPWSVDFTPGGELVVLESEAKQVKVFQVWQEILTL